MIGYLAIGTNNLEQGIAFYDALFVPSLESSGCGLMALWRLGACREMHLHSALRSV